MSSDGEEFEDGGSSAIVARIHFLQSRLGILFPSRVDSICSDSVAAFSLRGSLHRSS